MSIYSEQIKLFWAAVEWQALQEAKKKPKNRILREDNSAPLTGEVIGPTVQFDIFWEQFWNLNGETWID